MFTEGLNERWAFTHLFYHCITEEIQNSQQRPWLPVCSHPCLAPVWCLPPPRSQNDHKRPTPSLQGYLEDQEVGGGVSRGTEVPRGSHAPLGIQSTLPPPFPPPPRPGRCQVVPASHPEG